MLGVWSLVVTLYTPTSIGVTTATEQLYSPPVIDIGSCDITLMISVLIGEEHMDSIGPMQYLVLKTTSHAFRSCVNVPTTVWYV